MIGRRPAKMPFWWLACLLAGCVQPGDTAQPFAGSRAFGAPVAVAPKVEQAEPVAERVAGAAPVAAVVATSSATTTDIEPAAAVTATAQPMPASADKPAAPKPRDERTLRNAFANAEDPTQAAIDLAGFLVQRERHFEALHVVDLALQRRRASNVDVAATVPLRLARAGLLRDVARSDLAIVELRGVVRERTAKRVAPALLFDLAQCEWVAGDNRAAKATLELLQRTHSGDEWVRRNAEELATWQRRVAAGDESRDPLANGELRDLFALLRAAPELHLRKRLLRSLATPPRQAGNDDRRSVRLRAIALACADESGALRAQAVQLAAANALTDIAFWETALQDAEPIVRNVAAKGLATTMSTATQTERQPAVAALLRAIEREDDEHAFHSLHAALGNVTATPSGTCDATSATGRAAAVAKWKAVCQR